MSHLRTIPSRILAPPLLHLLRQDRVLHASRQDSKEEGGEEGAEVEGHPGDGVGHHDFLPLPVHRVHYLIGQDWGAHAMGHLPGDNCEKKKRSIWFLVVWGVFFLIH